MAKITAHYDEVSCIHANGTNFWTGSLDFTIRSWNIQDVLNDHVAAEEEIEVIENLMTEEEERELAELMGL